MSTLTAPATKPAEALENGVQPWRWTLETYHRAAELGLFGPEPRLELIEGEVYPMSPHGTPHATALLNVLSALIKPFGDAGQVRPQLPLLIGESEPEPDILVVSGPANQFGERHPVPADVLLVVEISDTTLLFDRQRKVPLYAGAGSPEYWIVNLNERRLEVYRTPAPDGYRSLTILTEEGTVTPLSSPDARISVADLLPPARPDAA